MGWRTLLRAVARPDMVVAPLLPIWFSWWALVFKRPSRRSGLRLRDVPRFEGGALPDVVKRGEPAVLTGIASKWRAAAWTPEALKRAAGDQRVEAYIVPRGFRPFDGDGRRALDARRTMTVNEAVDEVFGDGAAPPLHLADSPGWEGWASLVSDVDVPVVPGRPFDPSGSWISLAGAGATIFLHYDLWHALLAQIVGRRRVVLFSPSKSASLDVDSPFGPKPTSSRRAPLDGGANAVPPADGWEVVLEPGDTLFIPAYYWHEVVAEDANISVLLRYLPRWTEVVNAGTFPLAWERTIGVLSWALRDRDPSA